MTLKAIEILMNEHQMILKFLDISEKVITQFEKDHKINREELNQILDFVENYADNFHHKKEEDVLFQWMAGKGFPVEGGPIQVMRFEHEQGRDFVKKMYDVLNNKGLTEEMVSKEIAEIFKNFSIHLRYHISKEDNVLYPMAMRLSDENDDSELLKAYANKFSDEESRKIHKQYFDLLERLGSVITKLCN